MEKIADLNLDVWSSDNRSQIGDIRCLMLVAGARFGTKVYIKPSEPNAPTISFNELVQFATGFESFLQEQGIKEGDALSVVFNNSTLMVLLFLSTIFSKRIFVPINPNSSPNEIGYILNDANPKFLLYDEKLRSKIEKISFPHKMREIKDQVEFIQLILASSNKQAAQLMEVSPDMPAQIVYTSGTTGEPKGVVLTHNNLLTDSFGIGWTFKFPQKSNFLTVTPLFHNSGQISTTLGPLWCGARTTAVRSDLGLINFWYYVDLFEINWSLGMAAHINFLNESQRSPQKKTMKGMFCGGSKLEPERQVVFEKRFEIPVYNNYGLTETTSFATCTQPGCSQKYLGSVGPRLVINEIRIVKDGKDAQADETGEIWIKGQNVFKEYLNKPEITDSCLRDGWLHTGDLGYVDTEGNLFIVDRIDNMVLIGGENVYPADVEKVIPNLECISEGLVSSIPHKILGSELVLVFKKKSGTKPQITSWIKVLSSKLSSFKVPKHFTDIEELGLKDIPKAENGKYLRKKVKELLEAYYTNI